MEEKASAEQEQPSNTGFVIILWMAAFLLVLYLVFVSVTGWRNWVAHRYFELIAEHEPQTPEELATAIAPLLREDNKEAWRNESSVGFHLLPVSALTVRCQTGPDGDSIQELNLYLSRSTPVTQDEDGHVVGIGLRSWKMVPGGLLWSLPFILPVASAAIGMRTKSPYARDRLRNCAVLLLFPAGFIACLLLTTLVF